jgi:gamma-glutamylcyclotransferase
MSTSPLYFAYGSNMALERIQARVPNAQALGRAVLAGYRLAFHKINRADGSGKCDVQLCAQPDAAVHGALYRVSEADLRVLDGYEGRGHAYERSYLAVTDVHGQTQTACIYVALDIDPSVKPFSWYKEHVLRGAVANALPAHYLAMIEAVESHDDPDAERHARELAIYAQKVLGI